LQIARRNAAANQKRQ